MSNINLSISKEQLQLIIDAINLRYDIDNDMVLDGLWVGKDTTSISIEELSEMRERVSDRVSSLLELTELKHQLEMSGMMVG